MTPRDRYTCECVAGVVGGRLVVAGGFYYGSLTSVEAYTGTGWTPLPPMPHGALDSACVLNGRLYVIGGAGNKLQVLQCRKRK